MVLNQDQGQLYPFACVEKSKWHNCEASGFHGNEDTNHLLGWHCLVIVVGYQYFRGPCCLHQHFTWW